MGALTRRRACGRTRVSDSPRIVVVQVGRISGKATPIACTARFPLSATLIAATTLCPRPDSRLESREMRQVFRASDARCFRSSRSLVSCLTHRDPIRVVKIRDRSALR